jgi:hypothetical protein
MQVIFCYVDLFSDINLEIFQKQTCNILTGRTYNSATGLICQIDNGPYNRALHVTLCNIV